MHNINARKTQIIFYVLKRKDELIASQDFFTNIIFLSYSSY